MNGAGRYRLKRGGRQQIGCTVRCPSYLSRKICCMAKLDAGTTLRRLRNRYRLVVMNDDTYEEVVTFHMSRLSVYIGMSTIIVVLVSFTVGLVVFTPLKYYIPGYGSARIGREYRELKYLTDSLEKEVFEQAQYIQSVKSVLDGSVELKRDTTKLELPPDEYDNK